MAATNIPGFDYTFNPWIGCAKASTGCVNCYAEAFGAWMDVEWGPHPRRLTAPATWRQPLAWDRKSARGGPPPQVLCGSLCDIADPAVPDEWRDQLLALFAATPSLRWFLLTKRPDELRRYLGLVAGGRRHPDTTWLPVRVASRAEVRGAMMGMANAWIGCSVEDDDAAATRIPALVNMPDVEAGGYWISVEPMIGPVTLGAGWTHLDWIICGPETGPHARPFDPAWANALARQASEASVPWYGKPGLAEGGCDTMTQRRELPGEVV